MEGLGVGTLNRHWRLIIDTPAKGEWNMAADEALAETVRSGGTPFLRFYAWQPGALSLGRFQNPTDGLSEEARTVPRVRRPTGGGGIWHADELTYSLACAPDDLSIKGVKASFERLCGFLLDSWNTLGWNAQFAKDVPGDSQELGVYTPACFAGHEEYDIIVAGKKLGGNAQRRDRGTIFQHGSLPISLDWPVLNRLFLPGFRPDPEQTTDLSSCGWKADAQALTSLLADAFRERMGIEWTEDQLSAAEQTRAHELVQERYGNASWTENGGGSLRGI